MKKRICEIFAEYGFEVFFCDYNAVRNEKKIPQEYKTVLLTCLPYYYDRVPGQNLSLYAALPDYHVEFLRLLAPVREKLEAEYDGVFDIYTDNSPINEKKAALISGLGVRGSNSLIITEKYGSFVFLGEILTDLMFETEPLPEKNCERCGRCEKACPSGAIKDGRVDPEKCLSAITQKKGELSASEEKLLSENGSVWGCDICQLVCPHNEHLETSRFALSSKLLPCIFSDDLRGLSDSEFRKKYHDRAFTWRGIKTLARNVDILERSLK